MKIGILNMQYSRHNYGALLQAAALEHRVRSLYPDACVEHIDARPAWLSKKKSRSPRAIASMLKGKLKQCFSKKLGLPEEGNYHVFSDFRKSHIQITEKHYITKEDFDAEEWDYDIVIVGSDQVFRVRFLRGRADVFFLNFLPESCRRVSYAASFGVDHWEGAGDVELTKKIGVALQKFDAISVREASGVEICKQTFGLEATHVLDPTLLVGRQYFDQIIDAAAVEVTHADWGIHCISDDAGFISEVPALAESNEKQLVDIYYQRRRRCLRPALAEFSSVPEWLALIRNTKELIFTDSFHCVCFCILFEKDFLVFTSEMKGIGRMTSLLTLLGLEDRICLNRTSLMNVVNGESSINYLPVRNKLQRERDVSARFLEEAIRV